MNFEKYVIDNKLGSIEKNRTFKELTTIGCGGQIKILYSPDSIESLCKAYKYIISHNLKYFIIGNGSNILASDEFFDGIVISLRKQKYDFYVEEDILNVSAFYPTIKLAHDLSVLEIGDLSFLGGIPGLLGGAIFNNCGAYNQEISSNLIDISYINSNGLIVNISNKECGFGYRKSIFHYIDGIIISARFKIKRIDTKEILEKRRKERLLSQPLDTKNMGSIFKNNPLIPAWKIIDSLGLRGFRIGDAAVSSKHANFIINMGNASSLDVYNLIDLIKKRSENEFGIKLISEVSYVG